MLGDSRSDDLPEIRLTNPQALIADSIQPLNALVHLETIKNSRHGSQNLFRKSPAVRNVPRGKPIGSAILTCVYNADEQGHVNVVI